jgi:polyisoprenoid-binding protein YceI
MKKTTLVVLVIGAVLASCSNNGKKVDANDAEKVELVKNEITQEFKTIKEGSYLDWRASHFGGAEPRFGKISLSGVEFLVNNNQLTNAKVIVDMSSITVENFGDDEESKNKLTGHLQSDDFFKVSTYPTSTFELTKVEEAQGDFNSLITGNLTILDTTKSISFNANITISENEIAIKSEDFAIDRRDWGLKYNVEGTEGVPIDYIVANDIGFTIDVTLTK